DFPLLGVPPIPVICSIILTLDFPLLEAEVALISSIMNSSSSCSLTASSSALESSSNLLASSSSALGAAVEAPNMFLTMLALRSLLMS
ncbi:hypothetical protein L208DRAFT_1249609, partial [Tricholoma matsutake]